MTRDWGVNPWLQESVVSHHVSEQVSFQYLLLSDSPGFALSYHLGEQRCRTELIPLPSAAMPGLLNDRF